MARIAYIDKKFQRATLKIIELANQICAEYAAQGFDLTLRQLYYQFVARDYIANTLKEYQRLGSIINDARLAGHLDWNSIVDRTRNLRGIGHWESPADVIESAAKGFAIDRWRDQPTRVECWIEKDALVGVLDAVCPGEDVAYFSCRGYPSQSEVWAAGQRLGAYLRSGQNVTVIHLGDHDPSGIDMTRDITERLELFIPQDNERTLRRLGKRWQDKGRRPSEIAVSLADLRRSFGTLSVNRIALNMDQVEEYNPPPNPAKVTDSRFEGYTEQFGTDESWELDALDPSTLANLIRDNIRQYRDETLWAVATQKQEEYRALLQNVADNWSEVQHFVTEVI